MQFNSLTYVVFMVVLAPLVVLGPRWLRNAVLLSGSVAFYAFWRIDFTGLVIFTAFVDWFGAQQISSSVNRCVRRFWLTLSVVMNLTVLCFFKYFKFAVGSGISLATLFGLDVSLSDSFRAFLDGIILPLGISFYTFHSLSYVFDVYRGVVQPVPAFRDFLTYVLFWTQLVAGPILRTAQVVPQLVHYRRPRAGEIVYGLEEILQGLFKKLVIADQIAPLVDYGYSLPADRLGPLDVWLLAFSFGFQIYFDFSGYSQIALGSARVMGFHFPPNFDWPYLASSPREFWQRWHISLSTWIRDYLYVPLLGGGFKQRDIRRTASAFDAELATGRVTETRRTFALFATWFIMGLWHGANWTFVVWGGLHGVGLAVNHLWAQTGLRLPRPVAWALTLLFVIAGWVLFRCPDFTTAGEVLASMAFHHGVGEVVFNRDTWAAMAIAVAVAVIGPTSQRAATMILRPEAWVAVPVGLGLAWLVLMVGGRLPNVFIYFQF